MDRAFTHLFAPRIINWKTDKDVAGRWIAISAADDPKVAAIQMIGSTFIQQLIVSVGTTEVYNSGILYLYRDYITNELSYPGFVKSIFLQPLAISRLLPTGAISRLLPRAIGY